MTKASQKFTTKKSTVAPYRRPDHREIPSVTAPTQPTTQSKPQTDE